jgi:hypothetical protein
MYCDPERLQTLQRLFDTIWMVAKLQAQQNSTQLNITRDQIARNVMHGANSNMTDGEILLGILESLGILQEGRGVSASISPRVKAKIDRVIQNRSVENNLHRQAHRTSFVK